MYVDGICMRRLYGNGDFIEILEVLLVEGDQIVEQRLAPEVTSVQSSLHLRGFKRVLISLYRQWLINRHKTEVNNIFEVGKVYYKTKTLLFDDRNQTRNTLDCKHNWMF